MFPGYSYTNVYIGQIYAASQGQLFLSVASFKKVFMKIIATESGFKV